MAEYSVTRRRPLLRAVTGFVAALTLFGCGRDGLAGPSTTTTPVGSSSSSSSAAPSSTTTTALVPSTTAIAFLETEVRVAYEAASRAFIGAAAVPDPDSPLLAQTHTGPMLEQRHNTLVSLKLDGRAIRYPDPTQYRIRVTDIAVDGDVARLTACVVDDGERIEVTTGQVLASGTGTVEWTAALRRVDGSWRLAERVERARWEGVAGCAVR